MKQYLDIVEQVLTQGKWKFPTRLVNGKLEPVDGGVRTLTCPNVVFSHDMREGFPLLTTKKMAHKAIRIELEGFIKGITDKRWYQERGCKIWNEWSNRKTIEDSLEDAGDMFPREAFLPNGEPDYKYLQRECTDLGPIYGYQWRKFDEDYGPAYTDECYNGIPRGQGTDQLKNIVDSLHNNPYDRRMVCSAWNPNQMNLMALPPCHWGWNVCVIEDEINLFWVQRSCDLMYGVPFNIASYALLLVLLAKEGGFRPANLSGMLVDCHIYEKQIEAAKEQLTRVPKPLPTVSIPERNNKFSIFDWEYDQFELHNYDPHPKLDFGEVVV